MYSINKMCISKSRKLTTEEIALIKRGVTEDNEYIDNMWIYINVHWLNCLCNCCRNSDKSGLTVNSTIYFSFDPDIKNPIDASLLLHEIAHTLQCKKYGYCCLIPRYICEILRYGYNGMYTVKGTLENEAEQFAVDIMALTSV